MYPLPPSRGPLEEAVKHRRLSSFTCFICATSLFTQQLSLPKRSSNVQLAFARRSVPWFQGFKVVSKWFQGGFMVVSRWFQGGFKGAAAEGFGEGGRRRGPGGAGPPQRGLGRGGGPPQRGLGGGHFKLIPTSGHDCLRRLETTHETTMKPP
jgi:hypothetical protein